MPATPEPPPRLTLVRVARGIAMVSGAFSVAVALLLAVNHLQDRLADPLNSPALEQIFRRVAANPADTQLRAEARALDILARRAFFSSQQFRRTGATLLLLGAVSFVLALQTIRTLERKSPMPTTEPPGPESQARDRSRARSALATATAALAAAGAMWILLAPSPDLALPSVASPAPTATAAPATPTPQPAPHPAPAPAPAAPAPQPDAPIVPAPQVAPAASPQPGAPPPKLAAASAAELESNWPAFRGPYGDGVARKATPPTDWDAPANRGVLWKIPTPGPGFNSPILWNDRLLLTTGTELSREILCLNAADGKTLWRHEVKPAKPGAKLPEVSEDTGFAAPTAVTDGQRIYAIFATGDVACVDLDGKPLWQVGFGAPDNHYGHGSSLVIYNGLLLIQYDQNEEAHLIALKTSDGAQAWKLRRQVDPSWASPMLLPDTQPPQLILNASPTLTGHDASTGRQIWACEPISGEIASSPARDGKMVFAGNEGGALLAVDSSTGKKIWETEDDLPDVSSPVAADGLVFLPSSAGIITCLKSNDGSLAWRQEYDEGFYSSPIIAGGMVYLLDRKGLMHIVKVAPQFQPVRQCPLGEEAVATPAFKANRIYLRGLKSVYCIGDGPR